MEYKDFIQRWYRAKRAEMKTVHGTIQTPVFANVGTVAAIKGAVSTDDLARSARRWNFPIPTTPCPYRRQADPTVWRSAQIYELGSPDPHGFRRISGAFSLAGLRKIKEEGVYFNSHIDGHKIFMGPEESMQIQSNLG